MNTLTVGLEGGLGNRMRVAASAAAIARHVEGDVAALWTDQWGMHCRFDQLFCPYADGRFSLRDATLAERIIAARPRPRNRIIAKALHKMFFRSAIYNDEVTSLCERGFDFVSWAGKGRSLLWTWWDFFPYEPALLRQLFRPLPKIERRIDERCAGFTPGTIGLHIRRTDNRESIELSPLELFFEAVDKEIGNIYLATDDEATKAALRSRYGKRVITAPAKASRDDVRGIQDAVVEMFALSRTSHIYGSAGSSFSTIAASLGATPLTIVQRRGGGVGG